MNKQLQLTAAVYDSEEQARRILDVLQLMHKGSTIVLADLAMVTKESDGTVHIKETRELSGLKGAKRGAIVTGIFGVIYPPSLLVTATGGAIAGRLWGRLRDTGVKTGQLKAFWRRAAARQGWRRHPLRGAACARNRSRDGRMERDHPASCLR